MTTARDDTELVLRLIHRDQSALSELYAQYSGLVFSIAMRVVQNSVMAEEIAQDTFLKLWDQPENWDRSRGRFVSWLLAIARYTAIDRLRREQRRPLQHAIELDDQWIGQRGLVDDPDWQRGREIRAYMTTLPPEQVEVIELAFFQGMSHSEIADYLNLPLGTVKTRVRLGLQKLKALPRELVED